MREVCPDLARPSHHLPVGRIEARPALDCHDRWIPLGASGTFCHIEWYCIEIFAWSYDLFGFIADKKASRQFPGSLVARGSKVATPAVIKDRSILGLQVSHVPTSLFAS